MRIRAQEIFQARHQSAALRMMDMKMPEISNPQIGRPAEGLAM
jgi:hypothetical protein